MKINTAWNSLPYLFMNTKKYIKGALNNTAIKKIYQQIKK